MHTLDNNTEVRREPETETALSPLSYEEWLETAPVNDRMKGLYERQQQLSLENQELKEIVIKLKGNRNLLLQLLKNHKHDLQGVTLFPSDIINFQD